MSQKAVSMTTFIGRSARNLYLPESQGFFHSMDYLFHSDL